MISINLIPPEFIEKEKQKIIAAIAGVCIFLVVAVVGAVSLTFVMKKNALAAEKKEVQQEVKKFEEIAAQVDALAARKRTIEAKNSTVLKLLKGRFDYPIFMESFVESLPPNQIAVQSMDIQRRGDAFILSINGEGLNLRSVISWLERLEERKAFSDINLGTITYETERLVFQITMTYRLEK